MNSRPFLFGGLLLLLAHLSSAKPVSAAPLTQRAKAHEQNKLELVVQLNHSAGVTSVAFSPDNSLLATSGEDGAIKLWNTRNHLLTREFMTGARPIGSGAPLVVFTPSGTILISAGRTVQFWEVNTGKRLNTLDVGSPESLTVSPDGRTLALGLAEEVQLWALPPQTNLPSKSAIAQQYNLKRIRVIRNLPSATSSLAFSHNGLLALGLDGEVRVIKVATGDHVYDFNGNITTNQNQNAHDRNPFAVAFAPDNSLLMSFNRLFLWKGQAKTDLLSPVDMGFDSAQSLMFSSDGKRLLAAGTEIHLFSWPDYKVEHTIESDLAEVAAAALSPDGTMVANGVSFNTYAAQLWNARTGKLLVNWIGRNGGVNDVAVSPNVRYLATATDDGPLRLWDLASDTMTSLGSSRGGLGGVMFSPNNLQISNNDGEVWDIRTRKLVRRYGKNILPFEPRMPVAKATKKPFEGFGGGVGNYDTSPDGRLVAAAVGDYNDETLNAVEVWDSMSGKLLHRLTGEGGFVSSVRFLPNGKTIVAGYGDGGIRFWDTRTWKLSRSVQAHAALINGLRLTGDGKHLLSVGNDYQIKIWNCNNGALEVTLVILPPVKEDDFSKEWLVYTPDGLYDGSPGAEKLMRWRLGDNLFPGTWGKRFRRKNLLQTILRS